MKTIFIQLLIFLFLSSSICIAKDNKDIITENDLKIIESGNTNSADSVIVKLKKTYLYTIQGKEIIIPAVPAIIKRTLNDIRKPDDLGEGEGELLGELIWALSVTGDERVKPVLLEFMACKKAYTWDTARGFLNLGKSVIPDIVDSLDSPNDCTKYQSAFTLGIMCECDKTGNFFSEQDKILIRTKLLKLAENMDSPYIAMPISALGYFGDETTVPVLDNIKSHSKNIQIYTEKALEVLNKRLETNK